MKYNCLKCNSQLEHTKEIILTSFPIDWVFECPQCDIKYYLLFDKTLCSEEDYRKYVYKYYQGEK